MIDIHTLTLADFEAMPLVTEGHSKIVRYAGNGLTVSRFKPTIHSFTYNRAGVVEGSEILRLKACAILIPLLKQAGVDHTYKDFSVHNGFILSDFIPQPCLKGQPTLFTPNDIDVKALPYAPPMEVLVKGRHVGSPKHLYYRMDEYPIRPEHRLAGTYIHVEEKYPDPIVRFTWRNPLEDAQGKRLKDEEMAEDLVNLFIDPIAAKQTALKAWTVLNDFLRTRGIEPWDICFFITSDGKRIFGEVSQDCARFRPVTGNDSLDKDVWRSGGSDEMILQKWQQFLDVISD